MTRPSRPTAIKLTVAFVVLIFVITFIFHLLGTGKLHVTVQGSDTRSGRYSYSLTNAATNVSTNFTSDQASVTKSVPSGSYRVTVSRGNQSYFSIAKVPRFLGTANVSDQLQTEKFREFVGDNPGGCMYYIDKTLISANCSDSFDVMKIHVPATADSPGYTLTNPNAAATYGFPQGIVSLPSGTYMLIQPPQVSEAPSGITIPAGYTLYPVASDLSLGKPIVFPQLDITKSYSMMAYKSGFIIYSSDYSQVYYYSSPTASPTQLKVATLSVAKTGVAPTNLQAENSNGALALTYGGATSKAATTTVLLYVNGNISEYVLPDKGAVARPCGTSKLCVVTGGALKVYDVSEKGAQLAYTIPGVTGTEDLTGGLLLVTKTGIVSLDADTGSGYYQYSLGSYSLCSFQPAPGGFLLCVTNKQGKRSALYIDQSKTDTDSIDKKISSLSSINQVNTLTISGRYIYVVPRGPLVYNSATNEYGADPAIQKTINTAIQSKLTSLGINPNNYTVKVLSP
jgi:hypothetical protein